MGPENNGKLAICMEIEGLAIDDEGRPGPAGCRITLDGVRPNKPYAELVKGVDPKDLLRAFGMGSIADGHECRIITPEEYEKEYGDDDED